jgi:hypothetical protein
LLKIRRLHNYAPLLRHSGKYNPGIMAVHCEITEVAHSEDVVGYPCSKNASAKCFDCGVSVCDVHSEHCQLCNQTFCDACLSFHNSEQHQKKSAPADIAGKMKRRARKAYIREKLRSEACRFRREEARCGSDIAHHVAFILVSSHRIIRRTQHQLESSQQLLDTNSVPKIDSQKSEITAKAATSTKSG